MTIIYFILILGITVFVHELGHFIFAKRYGVYVYEFSIGMGPRLFKFNRKNDETNYCIRLLPIGGFVQMAGEEIEIDESIPVEKRLQSKTIFQRFMIMFAGVMMNFIFSFILLFFIGLFNTVSLNNVYIDNSIIKNLNDSDKIIAINDNFINNYDKLALEMTIVAENEFKMTVENKDGDKKNFRIKPINVGNSGLIFGKEYGFSVLDLSVNNSNIDGVLKGETIISVNGESVKSYLDLLNKVSLNDKDSIEIEFSDKEGNSHTENIKITEKKEDNSVGYSYGFYITGTTEKGLLAAIKYSFIKFFSTIEQMIFTVFYLITGKISLSMLSGPVGIYNVVSVYSSYGISTLVSLLSLICINVGFINILPLPAFDGGHILFLVIEKIKGSKVNPKIENIIHSIGFVLLMILMILITYSDIIKLF